MLMTHLLLWGNAYAQIIRNGKNEIVALYPSVMMQWIWGFHLRSRPNVCRTATKLGVKDLDLLILENILRMTLRTALKRRLRQERSRLKNILRDSSIVKTQCL